MQFGKRGLVFSIIAGVVLIASCKKKDSISPTITFSLPAQGQIFSVFDTITANFSVVEETSLEYVSAKIVDDNFISTGASVSVSFSETNFTSSVELVIDNKLLNTGDYYVLITASDGVNEAREFRKIRIVALPKKRKAVFFSTDGQPNQLWKLDSLLQVGTPWVNPNQDIRQICVNSLNDRIAVAGELSPAIKSFDINNGGLVWSDNAANVNQIQRFTHLTCYENAVYVGLYDREVRGYGLSGSVFLNRLTGNFRPETIYADETYLVIEMQLVGDDTYHLFVHNRQTNALLWQVEVPMNVKAICALENDEVLLFGNDGQQAKVLHYDIGNNGWWEPRTLPQGILLDAVTTEPGKFAIAHESGLYSYTYNPNFLNMLGIDAYQDVVFDVDNNSVIGAVNNTVNEVSLLNGLIVNSFSQADSITSLDIQYTR